MNQKRLSKGQKACFALALLGLIGIVCAALYMGYVILFAPIGTPMSVWGLVSLLSGCVLTALGGKLMAFANSRCVAAEAITSQSCVAAEASTNQSWIDHAYPLQQVTIKLQGTRHSDRAGIIKQLETVVQRLNAGDVTGQAHDDDFGYLFEYIEESPGPSFFDDDGEAGVEQVTAGNPQIEDKT